MADGAAAFWVVEPGRGEIRPVTVEQPGADEVRVRTLRSGVSRGTESTVFAGRVPAREWERMRAPHQAGDFPGPVKYGYLNVGVVEEGPDDLVGETVFCLYPHQSEYVVPASAVVPVPDGVPVDRAVLAGTVETAVNALWDAGALIGDRVAVVGGGMVGCCVTRLLVRTPGIDVTLVDVDTGRASVAEALGAAYAEPADAPVDRDLVFHTSGTEAGLRRSLELAGAEGTVVDLSWYGDRECTLPLGEAFHSLRLTLRSSQVGTIAPRRAGRRTHRERLALALELLRDPAFDALLTTRSGIERLPEVMASISAGTHPGLCHVVHYDTDEVG